MTNKVLILAGFLGALVLLIGLLTFRALGSLEDQKAGASTTPLVLHGIETAWPSELGSQRLWSLAGEGSDYRPWLERHVAACTTAQTLMPPLPEKKDR